jgi:hypothetical protein
MLFGKLDAIWKILKRVEEEGGELRKRFVAPRPGATLSHLVKILLTLKVEKSRVLRGSGAH